jgi:esterase/lipase
MTSMNIDKDAQNAHNANTTRGGGHLSLKLTRSTDPKQAVKVAPPVQIFSTNQKGLSGMTTTVTNCGNRSIYRNGIAERERETDLQGKAVDRRSNTASIRSGRR